MIVGQQTMAASDLLANDDAMLAIRDTRDSIDSLYGLLLEHDLSLPMVTGMVMAMVMDVRDRHRDE